MGFDPRCLGHVARSLSIDRVVGCDTSRLGHHVWLVFVRLRYGLQVFNSSLRVIIANT